MGKIDWIGRRAMNWFRILLTFMSGFMLVGCGTEDVNLNREEPTKIYNNGLESHPELQAYEDFLNEKYPDGGYAMTLVKLDRGDNYELVVMEDFSSTDNIYVYTYHGKNVVALFDDENVLCKTDELFYYEDMSNLFFTSTSYADGEDSVLCENVYSMEDGKAVLNYKIENVIRGDDMIFRINDEEVTLEEYEDYMEVYDFDYAYAVTYDKCHEIHSKKDLEDALENPYEAEDEPIPVQQEELKPVIYLYPESDDTEVSVQLDYDGVFTELDPAFNIINGWNVTADRDGTIYLGDNSYDYLFWEGIPNASYSINEGFCVKGEDTEAFLWDALAKLGLNETESAEFIDFWLPKMEENPYNVICFQNEQYTNHSKLNVNPSPDTEIRVFMTWYGTDNYVDLPAQSFTAPERDGFTVVEWGGSEIK